MHTARWTTAIAAAALAALPIAASAQSTQSTPPQNPPAQQSQPASSATSQPSSSTASPQSPAQPPAAAPAAGQVDVNAVKTHLSAARDTLAQLTSMPEAAKLQGPARTQVSQLISDFNALISAQSDWHGAYNKVDSDLTAVLGPDASADNGQPVGTSGSTAAGTAVAATGGAVGTSGSASLDPAIRAKLVEFRSHLKEFEKAAGPANAAGEPGGSMPPSLATSSTANPADPAAAANPASPAAGANPSAPASSVSPASPTSTMSPADREHASADVNAAGNADAQKELDAISAILNASKTGTLTKAQTAQLKKHVEALRSLIGSR